MIFENKLINVLCQIRPGLYCATTCVLSSFSLSCPAFHCPVRLSLERNMSFPALYWSISVQASINCFLATRITAWGDHTSIVAHVCGKFCWVKDTQSIRPRRCEGVGGYGRKPRNAHFCKSQFLHKSVKLFFIWVILQDTLIHLWGSRLLQNDFKNTLCEIKTCQR